MVNNLLIRPCFLGVVALGGVGTLDSHDNTKFVFVPSWQDILRTPRALFFGVWACALWSTDISCGLVDIVCINIYIYMYLDLPDV